MKRFFALLTAFTALTSATTSATNPSFEVHKRSTAGNELELYTIVNGYGSFTVEVKFMSTKNVRTPETIMAEVTGNTVIATLEPIDASQPADAEFSYNWMQGRIDSGADVGHVYRVPFGSGVYSTVYSIANAQMNMRRGNFTNFKMWEFRLSENDTVFAVRDGKVVKVDGFDAEGQPMSDMADIYVEHSDGTIARYVGLNSHSLQCREGEDILAGSALSTAGKLSPKYYGIRLSIHYYVTNRNAQYPDMMAQTMYFDPIFATLGGDIRLTDGEKITVPQPRKTRERPCRGLFGKRCD